MYIDNVIVVFEIFLVDMGVKVCVGFEKLLFFSYGCECWM